MVIKQQSRQSLYEEIQFASFKALGAYLALLILLLIGVLFLFHETINSFFSLKNYSLYFFMSLATYGSIIVFPKRFQVYNDRFIFTPLYPSKFLSYSIRYSDIEKINAKTFEEGCENYIYLDMNAPKLDTWEFKITNSNEKQNIVKAIQSNIETNSKKTKVFFNPNFISFYLKATLMFYLVIQFYYFLYLYQS